MSPKIILIVFPWHKVQAASVDRFPGGQGSAVENFPAPPSTVNFRSTIIGIIINIRDCNIAEQLLTSRLKWWWSEWVGPLGQQQNPFVRKMTMLRLMGGGLGPLEGGIRNSDWTSPLPHLPLIATYFSPDGFSIISNVRFRTSIFF